MSLAVVFGDLFVVSISNVFTKFIAVVSLYFFINSRRLLAVLSFLYFFLPFERTLRSSVFCEQERSTK